MSAVTPPLLSGTMSNPWGLEDGGGIGDRRRQGAARARPGVAPELLVARRPGVGDHVGAAAVADQGVAPSVGAQGEAHRRRTRGQGHRAVAWQRRRARRTPGLPEVAHQPAGDPVDIPEGPGARPHRVHRPVRVVGGEVGAEGEGLADRPGGAPGRVGPGEEVVVRAEHRPAHRRPDGGAAADLAAGPGAVDHQGGALVVHRHRFVAARLSEGGDPGPIPGLVGEAGVVGVGAVGAHLVDAARGVAHRGHHPHGHVELALGSQRRQAQGVALPQDVPAAIGPQLGARRVQALEGEVGGGDRLGLQEDELGHPGVVLHEHRPGEDRPGGRAHLGGLAAAAGDAEDRVLAGAILAHHVDGAVGSDRR